jgi:arylsulfatase A-like enzyme
LTDQPTSITDDREELSMSDVERVEEEIQPAQPSRGILAMALWLGVVIGLVELGMLLVEKQNNHVASLGALRLNRHYLWMVPVSHLVIFACFGLAWELIRWFKPELAHRFAPRALGALTLLALLLTIRQLDTIACVLLAGGLAWQLVPRVSRLGPVFRSVVKYSLPPLLAVVLLLIVGRHAQFALAERWAESKPVAKGVPNVLFIVLDTVRAKSLGIYGYARDTSPNLAKLVNRGVGFADARSAAPWTLPSHATMFTGHWPSELFEHPEQKLDDSVPTLAEYLGQNGYTTAGFVANTFYCNSGFGLSRGFDHYEDFYENFGTSPGEILRHSSLGRRMAKLVTREDMIRPDGRKDADQISGDFLRWQAKKSGRPFFAFLNYLDAHAPYVTPANATRHFGLTPKTPADFRLLADWQKLTSPPKDPREIELARDAYDDCISYLDAALGRLFDELEHRGVLDDTLVIVTADHGEEIGEHDLVGHGRSLYREELHVPLLMARPGVVPSGKIVFEPVSLRDLPATIVDVLGLSEGSPFPGQSIAPLWKLDSKAGTIASNGLVRSEVALREKVSTKANLAPALRGPMTAVVAEGMSYIRNADGSEELYRLLEDPAESKNLAGVEADKAALGRLRGLADRKTDEPPSSRITASTAPSPGSR